MTWGLLLLCLAGSPAWASEALAPQVVDRVVAVVNDDVILLSEVYSFGEYIEAAARQDPTNGRAAAEKQVLDRLIERTLIDQEIHRLGLEVTDQEVDRRIDAVARANNLDRAGVRVEVERSGMTWDAYREEIRQALREESFMGAVLRPRINISENDLQDAWRKANAGAPMASDVLAIFLAFPSGADESAKELVRAKARDLRNAASTGADFAALSRENDQGPFGAQDGKMGSFKEGELVAVLDRAVWSTAVGAVAEPIETAQGIFLLKVSNRSAAGQDFETMKPELMELVYKERAADEQARWFEQARRAAAIRVLPPPAAPAASPPAGPAEGVAPAAPAEWGAPTATPTEGAPPAGTPAPAPAPPDAAPPAPTPAPPGSPPSP